MREQSSKGYLILTIYERKQVLEIWWRRVYDLWIGGNKWEVVDIKRD